MQQARDSSKVNRVLIRARHTFCSQYTLSQKRSGSKTAVGSSWAWLSGECFCSAEGKNWLTAAFRMAMELRLNQPPPEDLPERERLNRVRTWLNCYCVDGSHAIQFGKMPMLRLDDFLARSSTYWYRSSHMNLPLDVHLCAYVQILTIMAKWRMTITEQAKNESTTVSRFMMASVVWVGADPPPRTPTMSQRPWRPISC